MHSFNETVRCVVVALLMTILACAASSEDLIYRYRDQSLTELFVSAKAARANNELSEDSFRALLQWLRNQEKKLFSEARSHKFRDITEHNYWLRSKLKFPSTIQQEIEKK